MLDHLTSYLFQFKLLSVPGVGTFRVVTRPAQFNVVDRLMEPPAFAVELHPEADVPPHQLAYLERQTGFDGDTLHHELRRFGNAIRERRLKGGFVWEGVGTLTEQDEVSLTTHSLQSLPAEKVIRQDAAHKVLIGDRQMQSDVVIEDHSPSRPASPRSVVTIVAWVLVILAVLFLVVWMYLGKFKINAAGSHLPVALHQPLDRHHI